MSWRATLVAVAAVAVAAWALAGPPAALAYPEFETWVEAESGRFVNCALCHAHPDGPEGVKPGQIRALDAAALERLNRARAVFEPGQEVDSPILNDFGDHIMERLGKRRFLEIRTTDPGLLADELGAESDLDGDGIPDATEYREGTHPLDARHGAPLRLLGVNLARHWFDILMIALATLFGLYGLNHLLEWAARRAEEAEAAEEPFTGSPPHPLDPLPTLQGGRGRHHPGPRPAEQLAHRRERP
jgi:hypothetical protein